MEKFDKSVLVLVRNESESEVLEGASRKALRLARTLTSGRVAALQVEGVPDAKSLADSGADIVFVPDAGGYSSRIPGAIADAAAAGVASIEEPGAVILVGDSMGRAVTGLLAEQLGCGGVVDVNQLEAAEAGLVGEKSALGGSWSSRFMTRDGLGVFALRPGAGTDEPVSGGSAELITLPVPLSEGTEAVRLVSSMKEPKGARISLSGADVVVVGGRGVNGDFELVGRLADSLGGAVGATRVACDEGWVERSAQVGQTGFTVAPKLYVGLGVSGAVHHTCGMLGSETVVAVVDDPDAPIIEIADFAVVGDVEEVVPQALEALRADG